MTENDSVIDLRESALDFERFGVRLAKLLVTSAAQPARVISQARDRGLQMVIARCDCRHIDVAQALEVQGFRLMDTLVYYSQRLASRRLASLPKGYTWRLATPEDAEKVQVLSRMTFTGYLGHYHADRRLDARACDSVYADWARRSCLDAAVAQAVILIEHQSESGPPELAAFATHSSVDPQTWDGVLYGVSPAHQGKGLYGELIALGGAVGAQHGHATMRVSTQVTNLSVQKSWCKQGFLPIKSTYTFHAWLNEGPH